jgi:hypothetical protein
MRTSDQTCNAKQICSTHVARARVASLVGWRTSARSLHVCVCARVVCVRVCVCVCVCRGVLWCRSHRLVARMGQLVAHVSLLP